MFTDFSRAVATLPLPQISGLLLCDLQLRCWAEMKPSDLSSIVVWVVWHISHGIVQYSDLFGLPLSGSGVVQFLFCLPRSSLRPCTRSGLESCSALLLLALCSSLLTRLWDWLMKSGLKSSKASWRGERCIYTVSSLLVGRIQYNSKTLILRKEEKKKLHWVRIYSENILNLLLNLGESFSQPCNS